MEMVPDFRRDNVWIPAGVYPGENRGGYDNETESINQPYFDRMMMWALLFFAHASSLCPGSTGISFP